MKPAQEEEFVEFVEINSARFLRMAELLVGDRDLAEDLMQTSLLKLYRVWGRERRAEPMAYLRRIMMNTRTDWWRRASTYEPARTSVGAAVPEVVEGDHTEAHARRDVLRRALAHLSLHERAVLVLRFYEDLTEVDAAAVLGVSVGTVKSTASRALAKLRQVGADLSMEETR
jgi:RNA polymerase sigma-70 factor (sigma-E family)